MTGKHFEDRAPDAPRLTAYDEDHLADYIRLLDTDDEGADWRDVAVHIFGIDPAAEPERARAMHESHLARALDDRSGLRISARPARHGIG